MEYSKKEKWVLILGHPRCNGGVCDIRKADFCCRDCRLRGICSGVCLEGECDKLIP